MAKKKQVRDPSHIELLRELGCCKGFFLSKFFVSSKFDSCALQQDVGFRLRSSIAAGPVDEFLRLVEVLALHQSALTSQSSGDSGRARAEAERVGHV